MLATILIGIATVIVLLLLVAAMMPKKYELSSSIVINRPQAAVFEYIRHIKNQERYSKWVMADPNLNIVYTGTDGEVGFISTWKSEVKNVGEGAQEITKIFPGQGYEVEIRFEKPFKGTSYAVAMTQSLSDDETKVTTTFKTSMPFPMNAMAPMLKKMLLKDMDETSANLKKQLEQ
jgi:ABC-type lipoprotein release transport system permease subunit